MKRSLLFASILAAVAGVAPAFAAGVTLISQATVQTGGGFPYVINQSGSYQLSSNLIVPCGNADGIDIVNANVTLDLNGFTMSCSVANAFNGVSLTNNTAAGVMTVVIMNGMITGFGGARRGGNGPTEGSGIALQSSPTNTLRGKVDHVQVVANGNGITTDNNSNLSVTECTVAGNDANGVTGNFELRVTDSDISDNTGVGVLIGEGVVTGSHIRGNGTGVLAAGSTSITNNVIEDNGTGIAATGSLTPLVGYGLNTFGNIQNVNASGGTFVSMKNNVSSSGAF